MSTHRFILEPYKGIATRHTCRNVIRNVASPDILTQKGRLSFLLRGSLQPWAKLWLSLHSQGFFERIEKNETFWKDDTISYKKREMPKPLPTSYIDENIMQKLSRNVMRANNLSCFYLLNSVKLLLFLWWRNIMSELPNTGLVPRYFGKLTIKVRWELVR